jgi:outer membrane lipoprotein SlyB
MINSPAVRDAWTVALMADAGGGLRGGEPLAEFIVRADDGATLSIVQANDQGFRMGDRVVIVRAAQTRLARPT